MLLGLIKASLMIQLHPVHPLQPGVIIITRQRLGHGNSVGKQTVFSAPVLSCLTLEDDLAVCSAAQHPQNCAGLQVTEKEGDPGEHRPSFRGVLATPCSHWRGFGT